MSGLIPKAEILGIENIAHLAAGGETPVLLDCVTAIHRFLIDKGAGMPGRERMAATAGQTRKRLARLLGASADEIALLWNATAGLHTILMGIDWRPGDNIVVAASEFISLLTVWHHCGAVLRKVGTETHATLDDVANAIDARTRLIVVSHVSYLTGARINIAAVRDLADLYGARLVVDASHSLGVVTVDGSLCDAIVSCSYKWLFGTHGVGVFFVNATRWPDLQPAVIGWNSVVSEEGWRYGTNLELKSGMSRFECGNLSFMSIYYLESGLAKLEKLGIASIEGHVLELGGELRAGLARLNLSLLTPEAPEQRAGNICFATHRCVELEAHLRARGILTWGDDGRLRISVHAYNDSSDIERVLKELQVITA